MLISLPSISTGAPLWAATLSLATLCVACTTTPEVPEDLLPATVDEQPALAASAYEAFFTLAADVPFVVDYAQNVSGAPYTARWGAHAGPLVTTTNAVGGKTQKVVQRYTIGVAPQAAMVTKAEIVYATASDVPAMSFFGADGIVDLLSAPYAIGSYTTSGEPAPGEMLVYDRDYAAVVARAKVNGFYSGTDIVVGGKTHIVYSGLSGLSD
ncbi:MAG: hypothetical protein KBF88_10550, partial [Polyangiaceae bacterium]|nr:hypothetical protein [Polyangiaceae bacterium]